MRRGGRVRGVREKKEGGRERGWKARLVYLCRGPEFLVTPLFTDGVKIKDNTIVKRTQEKHK